MSAGTGKEWCRDWHRNDMVELCICWDFLLQHEQLANHMASLPGLLLLRSYFIGSGCNLRLALSLFLELR